MKHHATPGSRPLPPSLSLSLAVRGPLHTLHPGDVVCAERGERLETLLGSCVAIVLTDRRHTVGAMCHIVHTRQPTDGVPATGAYAEVAFDTMFELLRTRGIDPRQCLAYVYGGGNMFPGHFAPTGCGHVGERNAAWVLDELERDGISVLIQDLGGCAYRRLSWTVGPDTPRVISVPV